MLQALVTRFFKKTSSCFYSEGFSADEGSWTHTGLHNVNEFGLNGDDNEEKFTTQLMGLLSFLTSTFINVTTA